jgi:phage baseplate assembly protein W
VQEAVDIILGTAPGERPMRPEFGCGIHNYVFESIDASTLGKVEYEIRAALDRWEPRIHVIDVEPDVSRIDQGVLLIDITYRLRATNDLRNLVYPFYTIPSEAE